MNMFDEAEAIRAMIDMRSSTQQELAKGLGVSQSYIANKLRLLGLSPIVRAKITKGSLSERHARALLRLNGEKLQLEVLEKILERSLTVAESEALVDLIQNREAPSTISRLDRAKAKDGFIDSLENGVKALTAVGITARMSQSYLEKKTYITICIDER